MSGPNWRQATASSFGPQVPSTRASYPMPGFGTSGHNARVYISKRHTADSLGKCSPGPAQYTRPSAWSPAMLGRQLDSTTKSAPAFGFGSAARFTQGAAKSQPGPGKYDQRNIWKDHGFVAHSRHRSANKTKIGTETRFPGGGINKGQTPGPGQYRV
eukprot:TRINITY_DN4941_c0_g3_i5.p1 TRINITY_DN4941_c0_g3~~TRINITY_DN4941_c0_g3_i5.p1  ORF type:complete len:157 (-),score=6.70 TRINITY_DN4941_c0_g3_i5:329-799(-)